MKKVLGCTLDQGLNPDYFIYDLFLFFLKEGMNDYCYLVYLTKKIEVIGFCYTTCIHSPIIK